MIRRKASGIIAPPITAPPIPCSKKRHFSLLGKARETDRTSPSSTYPRRDGVQGPSFPKPGERSAAEANNLLKHWVRKVETPESTEFDSAQLNGQKRLPAEAS